MIIILNNAFIYKSARLQKLYKQASIILKFLPLYSPDFNLIKVIFKDLKLR